MCGEGVNKVDLGNGKVARESGELSVFVRRGGKNGLGAVVCGIMESFPRARLGVCIVSSSKLLKRNVNILLTRTTSEIVYTSPGQPLQFTTTTVSDDHGYSRSPHHAHNAKYQTSTP